MPSARVNLSDKIRQAIETEISTGQLVAGSRIDEQALMERFEVSRTPAREAMLQLVSAGLLVAVPRQGAMVAGLSAPQYVAMLEILVELEALAARLSARRMPEVLRRTMHEAHEACRASAERDDPRAYFEANRAFHEAIYDGSMNEMLASQLRAMRLRMRQPQGSLFDRPGRTRNSFAEHQVVLDAILRGDEDAAHQAMSSHISVGGNTYADIIARLPFGPSPPALPAAHQASPAPARGSRSKTRT